MGAPVFKYAGGQKMSGFVAITVFLVGILPSLSDVYVGMENGLICHHVVIRFKEVLHVVEYGRF